MENKTQTILDLIGDDAERYNFTTKEIMKQI